MQNFLKRLTGIAAAAALGVVLVAATARPAGAQAPAAPAAAAQAGQAAAQPEKKYKDTAEYDIINAVVIDVIALGSASPNAQKTLTDLNTWAQKYPETDYANERLFYFMQAYSAPPAPQPDKVLEYGAQLQAKGLKTVLTDQSQILRVLYLMTANTRFLKDPTPAQFAIGQKAAKELQTFIPTYFTPANKAAAVSEADWAQVRTQVEQEAAATLLHIAMYSGNQAYAKKDYPAAEQAYRQAQKDYPDNGLIAYQLGLAMYLQKTADKSAGIYEIARGVAMDPAKGGIADAVARTAGLTYLGKVYTSYHGSDEGIDQLKQLALASPTPAPDFKIKTASEVAEEKQKIFEEKYPELATWMKIKGMLSAPDGEQAFSSQMKETAMPKLKGQVMGGAPECRSKAILVAIPEPDQKSTLIAEITLKLEAAMVNSKPVAGTEIVFDAAVPSAFTKEPFMLTLDIEKAKIEGLKTEPCTPPAAQKTGVKKAGAPGGAAKKAAPKK